MWSSSSARADNLFRGLARAEEAAAALGAAAVALDAGASAVEEPLLAAQAAVLHAAERRDLVLAALVALRKAEYARYHDSDPANRFETARPPYDTRRLAAATPDPSPAVPGEGLRGIACYPGVVEAVLAALRSGEDRLFSSYQVTPDLKLWIITEWDRSVTTLLLPSEY